MLIKINKIKEKCEIDFKKKIDFFFNNNCSHCNTRTLLSAPS